MAGNGPPPKGTRVRERDTPATIATVVVSDELAGPDLPLDILAEGETWHPQTLRWWDNLRRLSHLRWETPAGWDVMIDTAYLHHKMWTYNRTDLAAEVRLRTAQFGITPADRARLRMDVVVPAPSPTEATGGAAPPTTAQRSQARRSRVKNSAAKASTDKPSTPK